MGSQDQSNDSHISHTVNISNGLAQSGTRLCHSQSALVIAQEVVGID